MAHDLRRIQGPVTFPTIPPNPVAILVLILVVFVLDSPNTDGLVSFLQQFTLLMLTSPIVAKRVR
jgi:hypothetical protein